jgi:adenosylcobyric acid synthase
MGETRGGRAWLEIVSRNSREVHVPDGAISADGRIWGCYLHGIFANEAFRRAWLRSLGWQGIENAASQAGLLDRSLEVLAEAVEKALDMDRLEQIVWGS